MTATISANDQGFVVPPGYKLALISDTGNIIDQRPELATELFHAAGDQYLAAIDRLLGEKSAAYAANAVSNAA